MPVFKTQEDAWAAHEFYHFDTDHEGKFVPTHSGWLRSKQLIDWIPDTEPVILEVGCNSGGLLRLIMNTRIGSVVYGIDIQPDLIKRAKQKGIIAIEGKAEELPYENDYFDVVIFSEVLEHFFDPDLALAEGMRVLKPGGLVIGSVPHPGGKNAAKGIDNHLYHARIFTKKSLKEILSGLKEVEIVDISFTIGGPPQWMAFKGMK